MPINSSNDDDVSSAPPSSSPADIPETLGQVEPVSEARSRSQQPAENPPQHGECHNHFHVKKRSVEAMWEEAHKEPELPQEPAPPHKKRKSQQTQAEPQKKQASTKTWEKSYQALVDFHSIHGHCMPSGVKHHSLLDWVRQQRQQQRESNLSSEHVSKLDALGFEWKVEKTPKTWDEHCKELVDFQKKNGHCNITTDAIDGDLCTWLNHQKQQFHQLNQKQVAKLEALGVVWPERCGQGEVASALAQAALPAFEPPRALGPAEVTNGYMVDFTVETEMELL